MTKLVWLFAEDMSEDECETVVHLVDAITGGEYQVIVTNADIDLLEKDELLEALQ